MKRLMDKIGETVKGRIASSSLSPVENEIRKYILKEFARTGRPPSTREIVESLKLDSEDIVEHAIEKLQKADLLVLKGADIVSAYPFSAVPTAHRVLFQDGHMVYSLCATDALGIHFMLKENITILSKCPECYKEIQIEVRDGQVLSFNPNKTVEFVSSGKSCGCTAESICPFINFFCSEIHINQWKEKNPDYGQGEIYSIDEALEHGKMIFGDFLK